MNSRRIDTDPSLRTRASFGLVFLGGMGVIGAVQRFAFARPDVALRLWIAGAVVLVLALVPKIGAWLYVAWMWLGLTLGKVTSPIVLAVLYSVVIVPVALVSRWVGRDTMRKRLDPRATSYWEDYPRADDPSRYIRQY